MRELQKLKRELTEIKNASQKNPDIPKAGRSDNLKATGKSKQESPQIKDAEKDKK